MRRIAKASSAGSSANTGSGAAAAILRLTLLALLAALSLALFAAPAAWANGNVDVSVVGSGSGTVTSTSEQMFFGGPVGSGIVTPGQINCSKAGGPVCSANFANEFADFGSTEVKVTLTATADPDGGPFVGWAQADGTPSTRCTTPPDANPTCVLTLNGKPGPSAKVFAVFGDPPGPPSVETNGSSPGSAFHLATLEGSVNPNGLALLDCRFLYGTSTEYDKSAPCVPGAGPIGNGSADVHVSATTESLEPNTTYHFRLRATGALGAADEGEDKTFTTGPAPPDSCPNADIRAEQGIKAILLPDCMGIEMVSPPKKESQSARVFYRNPFGKPYLGGISPDNERLLYIAQAALAHTPAQLTAFGDFYVATREAGQGWVTVPTSPPRGLVESTASQIFTPYFSGWFHRVSASQTEVAQGKGQIFKAGLGGLFEPLSPPMMSVGGEIKHPEENIGYMQFRGASADHSHFYFVPGPQGVGTTSFLPGDPAPAGSGAQRNTYVAKLDSNGEPSLELLARDHLGKAWGGNCGAELGGIPDSTFNLGATSADGSRVYFSTRPTQPVSGNCNTANPLRILKRVETTEGPWISELISSECDRVANLPAVPACGTTAPSGTPVPDNDDIFRGASVDGTKVYFLTNRQLTSSDVDASFSGFPCVNNLAIFDGCDLYLYDASRPPGQRLTQVSAGETSDATPGASAKVTGVTAISRDGSRAYFTAEDVLTTVPGPEGKVAQAGEKNLYFWDADAEEIAFIASLGASGSVGSSYPVPVTAQNGDIEVGGDGSVLLFSTKASLTADDLDGGSVDVFRYDADAGTFERISKAVPGGVDDGAFDVEVGPTLGGDGLANEVDTSYAERGRWVSEDAQTIAFDTKEGLLPEDTNGVRDSYLWKKGQLYLIPGTTDAEGTLQNQPVVSHDGSTVAFQTYAALYPTDGDSAADVYVLRAGGGFPSPPILTTCEPDAKEACQGPAGAAPAAGSGASASFAGPGNVKSKAQKKRRCPKGKRKARRRGKVRCVPKRGDRRKAKRHAKGRNRDAYTDRRAAK